MYLTVESTQHKTDSASSKTINKKYPNLGKEGKKEKEQSKRDIGQCKKKIQIYLSLKSLKKKKLGKRNS